MGMPTVLIAGVVYVGILFAIATLYLPIAYIAIIYAIAGLGCLLAKQVSFAVKNLCTRRYNINMRTRTLIQGLDAAEAFFAVEHGDSVYFVAFQPNSPRTAEYTPVGTGGWMDGDKLYVEPCIILRDCEHAIALAQAEEQKCILQVSADGEDNRLYLVQDTPANRALALLKAGGYTAVGGLLLICSEHFIPHLLFDGEVNFLPCKGVFLPITE